MPNEMDRPNILLITTDQQRFDTIAAWGNRTIHTPHLNWLADDGISFTNCYADCPICMPSRATIMTGLAGYSLGLTGNDDSLRPLAEHPTLPGLLTKHGYQTHAQGKMHFAPIRAHYGFEEMELPLDYFREKARYGRVASKQSGVGENEVEPVISAAAETDTLTWWTVDRSMDFLESRDDTRPFFLWTSFGKPHPPFECCQNYWSLYDRAEIPEPIRGDWSAPGGFLESTWCLNSVWRMSPEQLAATRRAYYACITQIDYNLGRLFARMREMNLLENTLILFTSDHGDMLGDHGMGAKSSFFEGSAHVPMIVRPPAGSWIRSPDAGTQCSALVTLADVMPTVLRFAGVPLPQTDGRDLLHLADAPEDRPFFGLCSHMAAVMVGGYKYCWTARGGGELLFHIAKDPIEQHDLAGDPAYATEKKQLQARLAEFLMQYKPEYAKEGKLTPAGEAPTERGTSRWPGLHSNFYPTDVLH